MLEGKQYGPVLKGNEWVMSRVIDTKVAPDSLGLSHIVLTVEENDLADSLYNAIKGGADFANVAMTYSAYGASAQNGGDLGVMPFSGLTTELAEHLAGAKKGDILKVNVGNAIQILKVNRADAAKKHVLVATVNVPVEASSATRRDVHNVASVFSVDGKGSLDNFNAAASTAAVTPRIARLTQGDRLISGLENSREVARWAYGAKVGEISEIFNLGDAYVVAMLTEINNDEYVPVDQVSYDISLNLAADKKFAMLKDKLAGSSIDEVAKNAGVEVKSFENLKMNDPGIPSVSETFVVEPGVVGAIASTEQGKLSSPVKGYSAAVVFVVDAVNKEEAQTAEAERVRLQSTNEMVASQAAIAALDQVTEIEDLRGQYF
jgi:peptidyl-prolyl cis-trans isomerase D